MSNLESMEVRSPHGARKLSTERHYLVKTDGAPFFYLADTAWELLHRADIIETEYYLTTRASQGFTVIQTVILADRDGLKVPNPNGDVPFHDLDPSKPNEAYFAHVDKVVSLANRLGLVVALLPTWGDKIVDSYGIGPQIFNPENARAYGRFIGERYRDANVIWILGGDRAPSDLSFILTIREMALGLKEGDGGRHLMTFHPPNSHSSADYLVRETWLDFHMWHTGHSKPELDTSFLIARDRLRDPSRPVLDGEPCYENIPVMGGAWNPTGQRFTDADIRRRAYRAVFGGACGHTYGCNEVWMMHRAGEPQSVGVNMDWRQALHLPGANQMRHLRSLIESRPISELEMLSRVVLEMDGNIYQDSNLQPRTRWPLHVEDAAEIVRPTASGGQDFILVYLPGGSSARFDFTRLDQWVELTWFDPRHGTFSKAGVVPAITEWLEPPLVGKDWVLIADKISRSSNRSSL